MRSNYEKPNALKNAYCEIITEPEESSIPVHVERYSELSIRNKRFKILIGVCFKNRAIYSIGNTFLMNAEKLSFFTLIFRRLVNVSTTCTCKLV